MPTRLILGLVTLGLCLTAAAIGIALAGSPQGEAQPEGWAGALRPPGAGVPSFALADQDGQTVRAADLRGEPVVFTFLYSTCEDTCPSQVQSIRGALDRLGRDVPVVGVSVDPAQDTAARARAFLREQSMAGRMRFLLGSAERLRPVWRAFGIAPQRDALEHSAYVVLVDGAGRQRIGFPHGELTSERLAQDLRRLLG